MERRFSLWPVGVDMHTLVPMIALFFVLLAYALHPRTDERYSFDAFYNRLTPTTQDQVGYCPPENVPTGMVVHCANTGANPTVQQSDLWSMWDEWKLCAHYQDSFACASLQQ